MCEGFCWVDVLFAPDPGSPKSHAHDCTVPCVRSVNCVSDPRQEALVANPASGGGEIFMFCVVVAEQPFSVITVMQRKFRLLHKCV